MSLTSDAEGRESREPYCRRVLSFLALVRSVPNCGHCRDVTQTSPPRRGRAPSADATDFGSVTRSRAAIDITVARGTWSEECGTLRVRTPTCLEALGRLDLPTAHSGRFVQRHATVSSAVLRVDAGPGDARYGTRQRRRRLADVAGRGVTRTAGPIRRQDESSAAVSLTTAPAQ